MGGERLRPPNRVVSRRTGSTQGAARGWGVRSEGMQVHVNIPGLLLGLLMLSIFVAGVVLLVKGLRQREEATGPRCGGCGFDLRGLPVAAGAEGSRCPECGSELGYPGRVLRVRRYRRWKLAGIGAGLVLLALLPQIAGRIAVQTGNPERWTPEWMLAERVLRPHGDQDATVELARRIAAGTAGRERVRRLVEEGLAWQESAAMGGELLFRDSRHLLSHYPSRQEVSFWQGRSWAVLLEAAALHGYATPQQVQRFVDRGVVVEVYASGDAVDVQVLTLLGPALSRLVTVDIQEIGGGGWTLATGNAQGAATAALWWRYQRQEEQDRGVIEWTIDASAAMEQLGLPGRKVAGEVEVPLPHEAPEPTLVKRMLLGER
jgi:hypothetical protein